MTPQFFSHESLAGLASRRPAGYLEDLMVCAVVSDDRGVTFDIDHPQWLGLRAKYRKPKPPPPIGPDQWPFVIRVLAARKAEGEKGAGDTAKRILHKMGGDALAWLYEKATGRPCGCADRQERLNALYPY